MRVETGYELEDSMATDSGVLEVSSRNLEEFVINTKDRCEMDLVGGKASNISELARKGFPVPEGFCVTTKAYDYFMDFNSITAEDKEISEKIRKAVLPPLLAEIIWDAYHTYLHDKSCAVRSSSPAEDLKNASFAGQYRSFLNVTGEDALLDAVKECWASLWSRTAREYRKKMGIGEEDIKMAVLVQEMLPAEASGVLFTEDQMIIETVWGIGDILVGGKVVPDHLVIDRDGLKVVERRVSHKEAMSQVSLHGGVEIVDVPEHLSDVCVLEDDRIREVCVLGEQVEEVFGCPQDIEWALCGDKVVLLQARPISVKQTPTVWSRANIAETQPGYVTYLSRFPEDRPDIFAVGALPLLRCFGIKDVSENIKFMEYIYGHIYANMTNVHNTFGRIPGLSPDVMDQSIGHREEEGTGSKIGLSTVVKVLPGTLRVIKYFLDLPSRAEQVIPRCIELIEDVRHRNLQELSLEELDELVWEMYERNEQVFRIHAGTMLAITSMYGVLQKMLRRGGEEGTENLLTVGLEGMSSCQLGVEIWNLTQSAVKSTRVSELILSRRKDILEELGKFPEGVAFLKDLDDFMEKFGDRGSQELELSVPRWEENPDFMLSMVANCIGSKELNPIEKMEEQKKKRLEATDHVLKKLSKNPLEKLAFEKLLGRTQRYMVTRENLKTTWVRCVSALRVIYLAIAENLVEKGLLENRDDIFYLKMTEVSDIIAGNLKRRQFKDWIEERKKEKEKCEHLEVPEVIVGKPPPVEELEYTIVPKDTLEGMGVSYGLVTGRARVVMDPRECSEFKEGEILVAPVTDPGWTPLFVAADGLVMELGGTLSHGVIIAREYGIPAVVGVKDATRIIKTGQRITVDGNNGVVYIKG